MLRPSARHIVLILHSDLFCQVLRFRRSTAADRMRYLQSAVQVKPGRENILLQALLIGSAVGESVGELAVGVGMFFTFQHFSSSSAAGAFMWAAISEIVFVPILAFIRLFVYTIVNHKELAEKQQAATDGQNTCPGAKGNRTSC